MDKIRAIIDAEYVYGWYCQLKNNTHAMVIHEENVSIHYGVVLARVFQIDPATAAVATGKQDKHGFEIFGSKGIFQGGDRVSTRSIKAGCFLEVVWCESWSGWGMSTEYGLCTLYKHDEPNIEIITSEQGDEQGQAQ